MSSLHRDSFLAKDDRYLPVLSSANTNALYCRAVRQHNRTLIRYFLISLILLNSISISAQNDTIELASDSLTNQRHHVDFVFATNLQIDFQQNDFSNFKSMLGDYNINLMNYAVSTFDLELNGFINKYLIGLDYGYLLSSNDEHDSLDLEFNSYKFGLLFGYRIFETKRFIVTPKINIKWNNYRLINSDKLSKIPISKYLDERDLDIRFNQVTASLGLKVGYKIYKAFPWISTYDFMSIGIYGGYIIKVNQKPWIYSVRNRLLTSEKININHLNLGLSFTFYVY